MKNPFVDRTAFGLTAALLLIGASALHAHAGVDVEVDLNARVKVTHDPEFETQRFSFNATRGTKLNITLSGVRRSKLDMTAAVTGPGGPLDLNDAARFIDRGNRIIVRGLTVTETGQHELAVTADGTGAFTMRLKGNPQRVWRATLVDLGAAAETSVDFAAGVGARVIFKAIAPRGSSATPRFTTFLDGDLSSTGRTATRSHTVPLPALSTGEGGDLSVGVRNDGAEAGDINVIVTTPPKRVRLEKLDFRANRLGAESGDESAKSATVGTGGGIVAVDDPFSGIDGAGVDVPPGALPIPTRITVTSAADLPPESDQQPGGPAVEFGPDGLQFLNEDALVTLPLDVSALPVGTQPEDILIIKVEANGDRLTFVPESVDLVLGTATVAISSFSTLQANVPLGRPTINGRDFWLVALGAEIRDDSRQQEDSRDRAFFGEIGSVSVRGDERETDAVSFVVDEKDVQFFHDDSAVGTVNPEFFFDSATASWIYGSGGQTIFIDSGQDEAPREFSVSKDGSFLIHAATEVDPGQNEAFMDILVERSKSPPSEASLAGSYWLAGVLFEASQPGQGPLGLLGARFFGSMTVNANGTFSSTTTESFKEYDPGSGSYDTGKEFERSRGTWTVQTGDSNFVGTAEFVANDAEEGELTRMCPSKDRSMMIGVSDEGGPFIEAVLLIRKSTNLKRSSLDGTYSAAAFGLEDLTTYSIATETGPVDVPDFQTFSGAGKVVLGSGDIALSAFTEIDIRRDPSVDPGGVRVFTDGPFDDPPAPLTVSRTGKLSFAEDGLKIVGAVTPGGMFGFFFDEPNPAHDFFGWDVFISPPPPPPPLVDEM